MCCLSAWECLTTGTQVCAGLCVHVCASCLCGSVTDRMRPLSRGCWGDNQYRSPQCAATALSPYECRGEAAAEPGWEGARGVGTHTHRGPLMLAFAVFFMIRDKIMSLYSPPENIPHGCIIPVYLFCGGGEGYFCFFFNIHCEQCQQMSVSNNPLFKMIWCPKPRKAICQNMVHLLTRVEKKMNRKRSLQHNMTLEKENLSANNVVPIIYK